jgi:tRNA dimethylallyltransferase
MKKAVMTKTCIIIAGPTAVGKTSLAIALAQHFNTEIISADSRQCFKELNIGVAKPSEQQLQLVKHYFINSHSIQQEVNAASFEQYSLDAVEKIFSSKDIAIIVGGTGLYIKAFCEGLDEIPVIDPSVRTAIIEAYEEKGLSWLQQEVRLADPLYYEQKEIQNPQRLMRALEVKQSTGKSILSFQNNNKKERNFNSIKIALELPKVELYQHIDHRVEDMMQQGLVDEVRSLLPYRHYNALQTVGYKELFDYLDNKITLEEAIALIKQHTRNYAKRQLTWFKKDNAFQWFAPNTIDAIIAKTRQ